MIDIQNELDKRGLALDLVGIKKLNLPLKIKLKGIDSQTVNATISVLTSLEHTLRGTHMSRMVEIFNSYLDADLTVVKVRKLCSTLQKSLKTKKIYINIEFILFIPQSAPVSGRKSLLNYHFILKNQLIDQSFTQDLVISLPIMLLCPCSKAISSNNAHNQRSIVSLEIFNFKNLNVKKIINLVEKEASSKIYPLLKRVDEKYVTEYSYDHPKFVEDIIRDIALNLRKIDKKGKFIIECESMESIHNHNAYAKIIMGKV